MCCVSHLVSEDFNIHRVLTPANETEGHRGILDKPSETPGVNIEKTVHIRDCVIKKSRCEDI